MDSKSMKIGFTAGHNEFAQEALTAFTQRYGQTPMAEADVIVALGGDGHVLRTLYEMLERNKPVFAMRRTVSVGFLCNDYRIEGLEERLAAAQAVTLHPLEVEAETADGRRRTVLAINEATIIRETAQSARLSVSIDGIERMAKYSGDGILVSTPAGSTAYNHSCGGPIMPLDANSLVITAICGYLPRRWTYAVLPQDALVDIKVLEIRKRPVRIEAGAAVIHNVAKATIRLDRSKSLSLLFDPDQHLGEKIIREQFML